MRHALLILAAASLLMAAAQAAPPNPIREPVSPPRVSADVVTTSVKPAGLTAAAGGEATFTLVVDIARRWHLYDNSYVHDPEAFYIGIDLEPAEMAKLAAFAAEFPAGEEGEFMGEKVSLLKDRVEIAVTVTLPDSAEGMVTIPLVLTTQACDDTICLQPSLIPLTVRVKVE
jgi:hypothetical protein